MPKTKVKVEKSPKKTRKGGKKTNGIKRPKSSYIFFCSAYREQVKEDNPDMGAKEIMSELGKIWKELGEDDRQEFVVQALADKERYAREKASSPKEEPKKKGKSTKEKDPNRPKRKKSSYILFCQEKRNEVKEDNPEWGPRDVTSELGRLWRELDEEEKAQYKS